MNGKEIYVQVEWTRRLGGELCIENDEEEGIK